MKKSFREIITEIEEDEPLFDVKKGEEEIDVVEPDEISPEEQEENEGVENPTFTFEINGTFNFAQLEKFMQENEQGLEPDNYQLVINTKGKVKDEDYESFIKYIEEKMNFLNFIK